jgi:hypothetical protein
MVVDDFAEEETKAETGATGETPAETDASRETDRCTVGR